MIPADESFKSSVGLLWPEQGQASLNKALCSIDMDPSSACLFPDTDRAPPCWNFVLQIVTEVSLVLALDGDSLYHGARWVFPAPLLSWSQLQAGGITGR